MMKKLKNLCSATLISLTLIQPCAAVLSETEEKMQKFIVLTAQSPVISIERCVSIIQAYLTTAPSYRKVLEISEYFKYFVYSLYSRKLNIRDYNTLFMFFRKLESFGLPENLRNSIHIALYNLPLN